jgi:predicted porin
MKTKFLMLGALWSLTCTASAQTAVTVYGVVDAGLVHESGGRTGNVTKLASGIKNGSRLGFRGIEDLGDGLSALFVLEMGMNIDTGALGQGGLGFGRQAFVGLKGKGGTLTLGRQYTPLFIALSNIDPFNAASTAGSSNNIMSVAGIRMNNTVKYETPNLHGFSAELAYGFGEQAGNFSAGRQAGAALRYAGGPLNVQLGHANVNNLPTATAAASNGKTTLLGATYDFTVVKVAAAYAVNKGSVIINGALNPNRNADTRDALLGVIVPLGRSTLQASYIHKQDKAGTNQGANQFAVGYSYALSKRTELYTAYGHISNHVPNTAPFGFYTAGNASDTGTGNKAFDIGLRHTF